jgi:glutathione S-transferase
MKLYWNVRCGSFAPEAVAAEAGLAYERVRADYDAGGPEYRELCRLNPMGQIPTAILDDGRVMTESAAMCLWFAELAPAAGLLPPAADPDRPWVLRWLTYLACEVYPCDQREACPERYTTDPDGTEAVRKAAAARMGRAWNLVEAAFGAGPYLLGDTATVFDIYAAMLLAWHPDPRAQMVRCPKLGAMIEAVRARPQVAPLWAEYDMDRRL